MITTLRSIYDTGRVTLIVMGFGISLPDTFNYALFVKLK